jgi:hypothetical protein
VQVRVEVRHQPTRTRKLSVGCTHRINGEQLEFKEHAFLNNAVAGIYVHCPALFFHVAMASIALDRCNP